MAAAYSTRELIQLPLMDAPMLDTFGRRLLAQFNARKKLIKKTRLPRLAKALGLAVDRLGGALALQQSRADGNAAATKLDPAVDATWAALVQFLEAWSRLSWRDEGKQAQLILERVFEDRLRFTQTEYFTQWSEANARIAKIFARASAKSGAGESHAEVVRSIGGAVMLEEIRAKHGEFGDALGISEATDAPGSVEVREPFDAVIGAAKDYVGEVILLDDTDVTGSEELKTFLLHVIDGFSQKSHARRASRKGATDEPKNDPSKDEKPAGGGAVEKK